MKKEVLFSFVFGVVFLLLCLVFALFAFYLPKPANPQMVGLFLYVLQVVLAISASGVAAVIPGFLNVDLKQRFGEKGAIGVRAGGAIAVFVLVFVVNPRSMTLEAMDQRVGFDERIISCKENVPVSGQPLPGALQHCEEARRFDPSRWESYGELARIHYWNREYKAAVENYHEAFKRMLAVDLDRIESADAVPPEFKPQFAWMIWQLGMNEIGYGNQLEKDEEALQAYKDSIKYAELGISVISHNTDTVDTLYNQFVYLRAISEGYIWLKFDREGNDVDMFSRAIADFNDYLKLPGAVPQWVDYHLSCLYTHAARFAKDEKSNELLRHAKQYLYLAISNLANVQDSKTVVQTKMMKCRIFSTTSCEPTRGSEPMICSEVAVWAKDDPKVVALAQQLY